MAVLALTLPFVKSRKWLLELPGKQPIALYGRMTTYTTGNLALFSNTAVRLVLQPEPVANGRIVHALLIHDGNRCQFFFGL